MGQNMVKEIIFDFEYDGKYDRTGSRKAIGYYVASGVYTDKQFIRPLRTRKELQQDIIH